VDVAGLEDPDSRWFWFQLGAHGDRRGDSELTTGSVTVTVPDDRRAAIAMTGLVPGKLTPGSRKRIDLEKLSEQMSWRGLTPGRAAGHVLGRTDIGSATRERRASKAARDELVDDIATTIAEACGRDVDAGVLRRSTQLSAGDPECRSRWVRATEIVATALRSEALLDRRLLVPDDPHTLDRGGALLPHVRAIAISVGIAETGCSDRQLWHALGVRADLVVGGLSMNAIAPQGWRIPAGQIVTVPPAVLDICEWPDGDGRWLFVTENPSVLAAASEHPLARRTPLICLVGTPSALEVAAITRAEQAGWRIAARADFDPSGMNHLAAIRRSCPTMTTWRMSADDYTKSLSAADGANLPDWSRPTDWSHLIDDEELETAVRAERRYAFEEALMSDLLDDLAVGRPPRSIPERSA
jgi:hypothetical protein